MTEESTSDGWTLPPQTLLSLNYVMVLYRLRLRSLWPRILDPLTDGYCSHALSISVSNSYNGFFLPTYFSHVVLIFLDCKRASLLINVEIYSFLIINFYSGIPDTRKVEWVSLSFALHRGTISAISWRYKKGNNSTQEMQSSFEYKNKNHMNTNSEFFPLFIHPVLSFCTA